MEIEKKYNSKDVEDRWYAEWIKHGFFNSVPDDRVPYTIVIPPPNVTGVLHMGHMLNNTIQDVLIRRARMLGFNACWVPGTDHASIATEAKVVNKLRDEGIKKSDLSRDEFLQHAWDWKKKHGGIILEQLKKLGASCDWSRTLFTMDKVYSQSVLKVFVELFNKGYIYRGQRMINWDPKAQTALSDEEVIHKEVNSKLFYIKYKVDGSADRWVTIATTRPETLLGDTAVCVHPDDERYSWLAGKKVIVPIVDRVVPVIQDDYITIDFGTGCLKVTPAHDENDYNLGIKHKLEIVDVLESNGTMSKNAGKYSGMERFVVREKIVEELEELGCLVKVEDYVNKVGFSERTDAVIEPRLSLQWFMSMKKIAQPAIDSVVKGEVKFYPANAINTYRHWMENIKDWCVSRQLWWGHRIPAWYCNSNGCSDVVVVQNEEPKKCPNCGKSNNLRQDEDVLDTWFSSWLWPMAVFNGILEPNNPEINYYYPTNDLVTAPEIMFFWVARMIIAGHEFRGKKPFNNVYFTGIVRDKLHRKMSKSLGNSPNPLKLIEKFSADGVRVGMLLCSPAGNDLLFDSSLCEQGRNFCNKIWNAFRLIMSWEVKEIDQPVHSKQGIEWFNSKLNRTILEINDNYYKFRISEILMQEYKLLCDDFCSWFLEIIKPQYQQPIDTQTYKSAVSFFEELLKLLHPFMPFITEEIWHKIAERKKDDFIIVSSWPKGGEIEEELLKNFEEAVKVITGVRTIRKEKNIPNKIHVNLFRKVNSETDNSYDPVISKLCNIDKFENTSEKPVKSTAFIVATNEYFIPFASDVNIESERKKLMEELKYTKGFLLSVQKKLSNSSFVDHAPEKVVAIERKKEADALSKVKIIEGQLNEL